MTATASPILSSPHDVSLSRHAGQFQEALGSFTNQTPARDPPSVSPGLSSPPFGRLRCLVPRGVDAAGTSAFDTCSAPCFPPRPIVSTSMPGRALLKLWTDWAINERLACIPANELTIELYFACDAAPRDAILTACPALATLAEPLSPPWLLNYMRICLYIVFLWTYPNIHVCVYRRM